MPRPQIEELTLEYHGLSEADLDTVYPTSDFNIGKDKPPCILEVLQRVYNNKIGAEYMHVTTAKEKRWIEQYLEDTQLEGQRAIRFFQRVEARLPEVGETLALLVSNENKAGSSSSMCGAGCNHRS